MSERPSTVEGYEQYFYDLINRTKGQSAEDWESVLTGSGIPAGLPPGQQVADDAPHYGMTQQVGAGGVRGRLFLPTTRADDLGFFTHPFDVLADAKNRKRAFAGEDEIRKAAKEGNLVWGWRDLGGPPIDFGAGSGTTTPPSGSGYDVRLAELEKQVALLMAAQTTGGIAYGSKIALRMADGQVMSVVGGGGRVPNQPVSLETRAKVTGEWEVLTVEKPEY